MPEGLRRILSARSRGFMGDPSDRLPTPEQTATGVGRARQTPGDHCDHRTKPHPGYGEYDVAQPTVKSRSVADVLPCSPPRVGLWKGKPLPEGLMMDQARGGPVQGQHAGLVNVRIHH